jgi:membrane protein DedA with SNARE-associated domain
MPDPRPGTLAARGGAFSAQGMNRSSRVEPYGYWMVFIGALGEAESVLPAAGFAARLSLPRLPQVMGPDFVAGALGVARLKFAVLNMLGAALWAVGITALGGPCGDAMHWLRDELRAAEDVLLLALLAAGLAGTLYRHRR